MTNSTEMHSLLWSYTQGCFHIEPLRTMLEKNLRSFLRGYGTDFAPLFFGSDDDCRAARRVLAEHKECLSDPMTAAPESVTEAKAVGDLCDAFMADLMKRMAKHQQHANPAPQ
ncbi:hypothetical protein [Comamonas sp. 4034]|uniref:hypothetical protein n=1 Tax=Comamonas sp. 4034 TaxID=3156455 RepID=UPI003D23B0FC